jgi:uncharacterized protein with HEPN domain
LRAYLDIPELGKRGLLIENKAESTFHLLSPEAIESYQTPSYEAFAADSKTQDAIFYNLIIIGEAANQVSEALQEEYASVPWSAMIGTRNVIVHGYDQVKLQIVWDILQR